MLKAELELALTTKSSVGELRAAVASADAEADRVIRLAQDLLVLAQADHGTLPLKLTDVSVADAFAQVERGFAAPCWRPAAPTDDRRYLPAACCRLTRSSCTRSGGRRVERLESPGPCSGAGGEW